MPNQSVIDFTLEYLAKNGHVIIKLFESQGVHALIRGLQKDFTKVIRFKPDVSRAVSKEFYLIAIKKLNRILKNSYTTLEGGE